MTSSHARGLAVTMISCYNLVLILQLVETKCSVWSKDIKRKRKARQVGKLDGRSASETSTTSLP